MHISHVSIKNFRALADIDCEFSPTMNVIVGPNGVGKTTILQALRLVKGLLAPRIQNEPGQVLISLGAASPHFPQRVFLQSLAGDPSLPVVINSTFALTDEEIQTLKTSVPSLVSNVAAMRVGQGFANPASLIEFLQSPQGQKMQSDINAEASVELARLEHQKNLHVGMSIDVTTGQISPTGPLAGPLVAFLDQRLAPSLSLFSYFPADRALPMGEVGMQIGGPDAQQQLESHNSQPQLKYQRLKTLIINSLVLGGANTPIGDDFEKIFSGLLRGRRIKTISVNELGLLSIMTEDIASGRLIELDSLSSGEKNIALTFLLVARSVAPGGIVIFDEPELHLNPAVSRDLLPFMMTEYAKGRDIQFITCTHSPEVLSGAFKDDDCTLLHLKSSTDITKIGKRAIDEYSEALMRLGTSVSETLFYEGTILVEGESDIAFLETGYPDIARKYQIKDRGGRREIEKVVKDIQALEAKGQKVAPIFLIFDRDDEPTTLTNSTAVRVLQWQKRCVENYMLDEDVLARLLKDPAVTRSPINSAGDVYRKMRDLALKQLVPAAARDTYASYGYIPPSFVREDVGGETFGDIGHALFQRMSAARASMPDIGSDAWVAKFVADAGARKQQMTLEWEAKWKDLCDGKRLISDLHRASDLKMSEAAFKDRIVGTMRDTRSENWTLVKGLLDDLLKRATT